MVEFHEDDHELFQDIANKKSPEFGRNITDRAVQGAKPIIVFGQDEAIYKQNSSNFMQWVGLNGKCPLRLLPTIIWVR